MSVTAKVSIIMPAWNAARFISEAIESVLAQTYENWELIIVDDGSTDGTVDAIGGTRDPRIRLIEQHNAGASAARNSGLAAATADYVFFLDADDRLRPDALARAVAALDTNREVCAVYGDAVFMDVAGRITGSEKTPRHTPRPSGNVLEQILRNNFIFVGTICLRAESIAEAGGWSTARLGEDWDLWCRVAARGEFLYVGEGPVLEYRQHGDSAVRRTGRNVEEVFRVIDAVFAYPEIRDSVPERRLPGLKRKREAVICAFGAKYCFSAGQWAKAVKFACKGIWLDLRDPTDLILPGIVAQAVERRSRNR